MFRFLAQLICGALALAVSIAVVWLVLANRAHVTVDISPLPYQLDMPLYLIMAFCFLSGLIVGIWLYLGLKIKSGLTQRKLRRQLAASGLSTAR